MTDVVNESGAVVEAAGVPVVDAGAGAVDDQLIGLLVDRARSEGLQLTGEGGLLQQPSTRVGASGASAIPAAWTRKAACTTGHGIGQPRAA